MKKASREKQYDFVQRSLRNSFVKGKQSRQTQKEIPTEREIMQTIRYNLPLRNSISLSLVRRGFVLIATAAVLALLLAPITAHAQNNLYVSINGNGSNSGGSIFEYTLAGTQTTFASGLSRPRGLAFDGIGNFFVATTFDTPGDGFHGRILKFTPRGKLSTLGNAAHNFSEGVATDSAGNVFAMTDDENTDAGTIFKFAPDGTRTIFGSTPGQSFDLAFDSAGNLFAADSAVKRYLNSHRMEHAPSSPGQAPSRRTKVPKGLLLTARVTSSCQPRATRETTQFSNLLQEASRAPLSRISGIHETWPLTRLVISLWWSSSPSAIS